MKAFIFLFFCFCIQVNAQIYNQKIWATYHFGVASSAIDVCFDHEGNIIVLGTIENIQSPPYYDSFTTLGAHKRNFDIANTNTSIYNDIDITLSKFNSDGELLWATQFGSNDGELANKLVIDSNNNIYFVGLSGGTTGVATPGAFQEEYPWDQQGSGFLTKFDTNGVQQWGTYISYSNFLGLCVDQNDNIFVNGITQFGTNITTVGVYQENFQNFINPEIPDDLPYNGFVMKFDNNGNQLASTYLGKVVNTEGVSHIEVDEGGNLLVVQYTNYLSNNQFATPGCHQNMNSTTTSMRDVTITKLNNSLTEVLWSTYFGGNGNCSIQSVLCKNNNIYLVGSTRESNNIVTSGCYQSNFIGTGSNGFVAKFDNNGERQWGTYFPVGIINLVVNENNLYICGTASNINNILTTTGSYQNILGGVNDGFFSEFNTDGSHNWSSFFGGEADEKINSITIKDNNLVLFGSTRSVSNISTFGSHQSNLDIGNITLDSPYCENMFLAKFNKDNLSTIDFSNLQLQLSPNPNNGQFTITGNINNLQKNMSLLIYDSLGRQIASKAIQVTGNQINQEFSFVNQLSQGLYFAKISDGKSVLQTFKVLVD